MLSRGVGGNSALRMGWVGGGSRVVELNGAELFEVGAVAGVEEEAG